MTTDPRDVERLIAELRETDPKTGGGSRQHRAADTITALREKLEAAEAATFRVVSERNQIEEALRRTAANRDALAEDNDELRAALTTARAEGAANWLAGRDAAAGCASAQHVRRSEQRKGWKGNPLQEERFRVGALQCDLLAVEIMALTPPADLTAALDEHDRRVRDAALEEAELAAENSINGSAARYAIRALKKGGAA